MLGFLDLTGYAAEHFGTGVSEDFLHNICTSSRISPEVTEKQARIFKNKLFLQEQWHFKQVKCWSMY